MTGIEAFLHILAGAGVKYLFGNPGTTELPLMDALADDARFQYILGLQEVPVVAMADGYALASRQVATPLRTRRPIHTTSASRRRRIAPAPAAGSSERRRSGTSPPPPAIAASTLLSIPPPSRIITA